jgi:hypothetical protein
LRLAAKNGFPKKWPDHVVQFFPGKKSSNTPLHPVSAGLVNDPEWFSDI